MKFDVLNRNTGATQFTAEIDCADDAPTNIKLGLAVRWAVRTDADLAGANLRGANLARANLVRANLSRAYLARAYLAGAYLIDGGQDGRGHRFWAWRRKDGVMILCAGCREWAGVDDARAHYGDDYDSDGNKTECLARIAEIEAIAKSLGWI